MQVQVNTSMRPPYVKFETRAVEDREATLRSGHFVAKDVDFAIVTPAGSKDRLEKQVDEWFVNLEAGVRDERIPAEWLTGYKQAFKAWKDGQELPVTGTALASWGGISPAHLRTCQEFGIRSVEDLATANEETIARLGMGGRSLVQKAQQFLSANDAQTAQLVKENQELRQKLEDLTRRFDEAKPMTAAINGGSSATLGGASSPTSVKL